MCGITGFLEPPETHSLDDQLSQVRRMMAALVHRGPDDAGAWCDPEAGLALGFRRLAILDLSPTGHQPMISSDGRYVIIFNGEVYNHASIRAELAGLGHAFRGSSDTEVLLAAVSQWGVEPAVRRFNGMFAIALWDRHEKRLFLIRDRIGIKPLYYGWMGKTLLFGSELKALRSHPAFDAAIDRDVLALYLRFNYVPAPYTIYRGIFKLLPGCILSMKHDPPLDEQSPIPYWSAQAVVDRAASERFQGTDREAIGALDSLLRRSVALRMIADVPVGAFLSGGVDSSLIVALMQIQGSRKVKTFTIGFRESDFDEAGYARSVARHLGTEHTELYLTPQETRSVIPLLPTLFDEPFADSSQIPTYLVSKLAHQHVTVSLSGDGGDELFGGYQHYFWTPSVWKRIAWVPTNLRHLGAGLIQAISPSLWATGIGFAGRIFSNLRTTYPGDKVNRLVELLEANRPESIYLNIVSRWKSPANLLLAASELATTLVRPDRWPEASSLAEKIMLLDLLTYLPDDILTKVDRASMGVSLEVRAPFLDDHEVMEFALGLPLNMKIRGKVGKWVLRQVLYQYVPKALIDRPKMGFGVPIDWWLRGPLRDWAEALIDEKRLVQGGFFRPGPIRQSWAEHLEGSHDRQYQLWGILMFQSWLEANG